MAKTTGSAHSADAGHENSASAMDYYEHDKTYEMFLWLSKWTIAFCVALLLGMSVGFFLGGGLVGGLLVFVILMVISAFFV